MDELLEDPRAVYSQAHQQAIYHGLGRHTPYRRCTLRAFHFCTRQAPLSVLFSEPVIFFFYLSTTKSGEGMGDQGWWEEVEEGTSVFILMIYEEFGKATAYGNAIFETGALLGQNYMGYVPRGSFMGDGGSVALATCSRSGDLLSSVANVGLGGGVGLASFCLSCNMSSIPQWSFSCYALHQCDG